MLYPIFENYMNQIKAILNRLYPLEERKPAQIKLALLFGLVVFGVLFLLNPFEVKKNSILLNSTYAGLLTFFSIGFDFLVLFPLFPRFFKEEKWTIGRELIFTLIIICTISTFNILAGQVFWGSTLSVINWFRMIFYTAVIGIAPATISILINQARLLTKYRKEVNVINEQIEPPKPAETATEPLSPQQNILTEKEYIAATDKAEVIEIEAENEKDNLSIAVENFLAATSADNYVKVFYLENDQVKIAVLRTTLKKLEGNAVAFTHFFRCHRTAFVNMAAVQTVSGTAQGYRLKLHHLSNEIPVSRNLNQLVKDKLAAIHP